MTSNDIQTTEPSTEIAEQFDQTNVLPATNSPGGNVTETLMQHAQAMDTAVKLADAMCGTDLVPAMYKGKPGNGAAAILYGAELGLNPIQSLQQIFVVQGKPAIYARTMVALVKSRGYVIQTVESSDEQVTVSGVDPQTGATETATWSYNRAKTAGYTGNKKYDTDPQAMLYAKAATEVCRKLAPEVLMGVTYSREELELDPQIASVKRPAAGTGVAGLKAAIAAGIGKTVDAETTPPATNTKASDQAGADTLPLGDDVLASDATRKRLTAALKRENLTRKDEALAWISAQLDGRELSGTEELTEAEARSLADFLETAQAADEKGGDQ